MNVTSKQKQTDESFFTLKKCKTIFPQGKGYSKMGYWERLFFLYYKYFFILKTFYTEFRIFILFTTFSTIFVNEGAAWAKIFGVVPTLWQRCFLEVIDGCVGVDTDNVIRYRIYPKPPSVQYSTSLSRSPHMQKTARQATNRENLPFKGLSAVSFRLQGNVQVLMLFLALARFNSSSINRQFLDFGSFILEKNSEGHIIRYDRLCDQ